MKQEKVTGPKLIEGQYQQIGIRAPRGTTVKINGNNSVTIGPTGIYEINLIHTNSYIYSIEFDSTFSGTAYVDLLEIGTEGSLYGNVINPPKGFDGVMINGNAADLISCESGFGKFSLTAGEGIEITKVGNAAVFKNTGTLTNSQIIDLNGKLKTINNNSLIKTQGGETNINVEIPGNKVTSFTNNINNTNYPTTQAVKNYVAEQIDNVDDIIDLKTINNWSLKGEGNINVEIPINKVTDIENYYHDSSKYPTAGAVKSYVENQINNIDYSLNTLNGLSLKGTGNIPLITINNQNLTSQGNLNLEVSENKVQEITEANKGDNVKYPTNSAVTSYLNQELEAKTLLKENLVDNIFIDEDYEENKVASAQAVKEITSVFAEEYATLEELNNKTSDLREALIEGSGEEQSLIKVSELKEEVQNIKNKNIVANKVDDVLYITYQVTNEQEEE